MNVSCTLEETSQSKTVDMLTLEKMTGGFKAPTANSRTEAASIAWTKDYVALTKPRITMMILITVGAGAVCVPGFGLSFANFGALICTLIGTSLVAASASTLNQVIEKQSDALMKRTANRPLPSGRLTEFEAAAFGFVCVAIGLVILATTTTAAATLVAFLTWLLYVGIYTPMKSVSVWNTAVGTLPGAMPVLIGWSGVGGSLGDWQAWAIASIVVLWQFPHFMSIAWLYRHEYAGAGYRMWTTTEPSGHIAGVHAWLGGALLIAISVAAMLPVSGWQWALVVLSVLVGGQQLVAAIRFHADRNDITARRLLRSSLIVLPLLLLCVVLQSVLS
jgi:heme o synthase